MNQIFSVLIVEDHQINIDCYKRALDVVANEAPNTKFIITEAKNCDEAFDKIKAQNKLKGFDLAVLDISLPPSQKYNIFNGEVLGQKIKEKFPRCKVLVCTSYNDNYRLNNILRSLNPEAFLIKPDINFSDLIIAFKEIINDGSYYSRTILNLMRKKANSNFILDELDIQILYEISNGARMKELKDLVPLSKTGIERRKRKIRTYFSITADNDRELVLTAKEKGFI